MNFAESYYQTPNYSRPPLDPNLETRQNVINEIIQTEETYNQDLSKMNCIVTQPLLHEIEMGKISNINPQIPTLFQKLSEIKMISDNLRQELHSYIDGQISIGQVFKTFPKLIIIYFDYMRQFHSIMPRLLAKRKEDKEFDNFLTVAENKLQNSIESFLIIPIQRPPRYRLLLNKLLETYKPPVAFPQTPEDCDYVLLKNAYDTTCDQIQKLDERVNEFDEAVRVCELQPRLKNLDMFVRTRRLMFDCDALKFSRKRTEMRYLILFTDALVIAENTALSSSRMPSSLEKTDECDFNLAVKKMGYFLQVNKMWPTGEYLIRDCKDHGIFVNSIDILHPSKSFRVNLRTPQDKESLLGAFNKLKQNYPDLFHENLQYAPISIPDKIIPTCSVCGDKFSSPHKKHHCKNCGACICKKCCRKAKIPGKWSKEKTVCANCYQQLNSLNIPPAIQRTDSTTDEYISSDLSDSFSM